jgi:hypothetical protein
MLTTWKIGSDGSLSRPAIGRSHVHTSYQALTGRSVSLLDPLLSLLCAPKVVERVSEVFDLTHKEI